MVRVKRIFEPELHLIRDTEVAVPDPGERAA
jgi:hypothetical protein